MTTIERGTYVLPDAHCEHPADWTIDVEYDPGTARYEIMVSVVDDDAPEEGKPRTVVITTGQDRDGMWVTTQDRSVQHKQRTTWQPDCQDHLEAAAYIARMYCIMRGWTAARRPLTTPADPPGLL